MPDNAATRREIHARSQLESHIMNAVTRRTFEAKQHPKGSSERARLNTDPRTSEYMPSYKYTASDGRTSQSFVSKSAAIAWLEAR